MAKITTVVIIDDIDGVARPDVETIRFGLDGKSYEIDLGQENTARLREALEPFIAAARPAAATPTGYHTPRKSTVRTGGGDAGAIREWAAANGIDVAERGRIPQSLREQYHAATNHAA